MSLDLLQTKEINLLCDFEKDSMENDDPHESEELELKQFERLEDLLRCVKIIVELGPFRPYHLSRQTELEPVTDDCAEMIDNVEFIDDLEDVDETDLIDDIAADLLANVGCEWEKADQEYLGVVSSGDPDLYHLDQEPSLTIFEQMMQTEFWNIDQDEAESQESGVWDMSNNYVTEDDDDHEGGDMSKEEIEAEFYELLQNMVHELNQVKTRSVPLAPPVLAGYDDDRSAIMFHDRVFRAIITDLSLREFPVTFYVTIISVMTRRLRSPLTPVTPQHRRRKGGAGWQNVTFCDDFI